MYVKAGAITNFTFDVRKSLEIYFKAIVATSGLKKNKIFAQTLR